MILNMTDIAIRIRQYLSSATAYRYLSHLTILYSVYVEAVGGRQHNLWCQLRREQVLALGLMTLTMKSARSS